MMREAVRNERLATGQRLREAYQAQLQSASQSVQDRWASQFQQLDDLVDTNNPAQSFATLVTQGPFDSVLICNEQGDIIYPAQPILDRPVLAEQNPAWEEAERLEFSLNKFREAAEAYSRLAGEEKAGGGRQLARALQGYARCLLKSGDRTAAIKALQSQRELPQLRDEQGRSVAATAELRLLEILDRDSDLWSEIAEQLAQRLGDYQDDLLLASQRRFLMEQLQRLTNGKFSWPTQAAEKLAADGVDVDHSSSAGPHLQQASLPELWFQASPDRQVVGLFRTATIRDRLLTLTAGLPLSSGVTFAVSSPRETSENLMDQSLGTILGGWRLGLAVTERDPFDETSQHRKAVHAWIALLVIAVTCVLAWLLANALHRRLRLAKLKNDLVATVSHELKTPLASIRLLVDTLLEADQNASNKYGHVNVREYLELIAQENARLTRLIDNFLTFSRMERGMQRFDFESLDVRQVIFEAAEVFREHRDDVEECLGVDEGQQAWISADRDALVTAVVNLLENAWKYSGDQKRIVLAAGREGDRIAISVRDNGIGLSARSVSRVFERFYQVDQRVARTQGGCGLGLSIVRAIVQAHGGEVRVESQLETGSTFTILLPRHPENSAILQQQAAVEGKR